MKDILEDRSSMATRLTRSVMQHSVGDTIRLLENTPVQRDMIIELPIAQVMNRVSIAHLSIERTMKFVITEAGGPLVKDHDLPSRLKELRQHEPDSASFLEGAFEDAVQHTGKPQCQSHEATPVPGKIPGRYGFRPSLPGHPVLGTEPIHRRAYSPPDLPHTAHRTPPRGQGTTHAPRKDKGNHFSQSRGEQCKMELAPASAMHLEQPGKYR